MPSTPPPDRAPFRISGLDSIRFVCAAIVVLGHVNLAFPRFVPPDGVLAKLWGLLFNGPAAVIAFFVISGFCIHFPQAARGRTRVAPVPFYIRRAVRLAIPSAFAILLYKLSGAGFGYPYYGVLWSIICEAIYYLLYPALLILSQRIGWARITIVAFAVALTAAVTHVDLLIADPNAYGALGLWTWVVGLPVWLAGCWLAENWRRFPVLAPTRIAAMRIGVFALSVALRAIKFHVPPPWGTNTVWLNLFAIVVLIWLGCEASYRRTHPANAMLERAGEWSFSLYLIHPAIAAFAHHSGLPWSPPLSVATVLACFPAAYLFYRAIERPSHRLAVRASGHWTTPVPAGAAS